MLFVQGPTRLFNPEFPQAIIDRRYEDDPEAAAANMVANSDPTSLISSPGPSSRAASNRAATSGRRQGQRALIALHRCRWRFGQ